MPLGGPFDPIPKQTIPICVHVMHPLAFAFDPRVFYEQLLFGRACTFKKYAHMRLVFYSFRFLCKGCFLFKVAFYSLNSRNKLYFALTQPAKQNNFRIGQLLILILDICNKKCNTTLSNIVLIIILFVKI